MGSLASQLSDISTGLEMLDFYTGITGMSPQCEKKRGGERRRGGGENYYFHP